MRSTEVLWLTAALTAISAFLLDAILPAFGDMAHDYRTAPSEIAAIVGYVVLTFSALQLIVGPLSDRFGRKQVLVVSLLCATVGALGSACAATYSLHSAFRIIQGVGCAGFVLSQAILQDAFPGETGWRARIFNLTFGGACITMAPVLGAALTHAAGWRAVFLAFAALSTVTCAFASLRLPASRPDRRLGFTACLRLYATMATHRQFMTHAIQAALAFACHFSFIVLSPALYIDEMGYSPDNYGRWLAAYGLGYVAAGIAANYTARRLAPLQQIRVGLAMLVSAGALMATLVLVFGSHPATVIVPMLLVTLGSSAVRPASTTLALAAFEAHAGTAAAMMGAIRFIIAGGITLAITSIDGSALVTLTSVLAASALTARLCAPRESCRSPVRRS